MNKISIVNPETVRRHQTNKSTSKTSNLFPKSPRFHQPPANCPIAYYSNTGTLSNRMASLGSGKKFDFTQTLVVSPASTLYQHKSLFDESRDKGKSFGVSRDKSPDRSYLIPQIQRNPGPGNYENQVKTRMTASYTMRPRTIDMVESHLSYKESPGPGAFDSVDLDPKSGRLMVSKFGDSKLAKITNKVPRFPKEKEIPGPSSYPGVDSFSPKGRFIVSNWIGRGTRPFNQTGRFSIKDELASKNTPGPGHYEQPSEFGVYGDCKYNRTLNGFKQTIE